MKTTVRILSILLLACLPAAATTPQTIRVNAGGPAHRDSKGQSWSADQGFNSGTLSNSAPYAAVTGTTDPTLFKSARVALTSGTDLQYQFALTNGTYNVNLYFAETYYTSAGKRIFDVRMQGATVLSALDIFAQAGARHALVKSAKVSVTNGQLIIGFVRRTNGNVPTVSAVEILPVTGSTTAPSIATQPASKSIQSGQRATFQVVAAGTAPFSYQWERNGAVMSGATAASYTTPAVTSSDNGETFRVTVKNSVGSVTSNSATLAVGSTTVSAPVVVQQPASRTLAAGQAATFSVTANGTAPLSYQWSKNGAAISGATAATYTTPPTTTAENGSKFQVVLHNPAGSVTSAAATLTVTSTIGSGPTVTINGADVHQEIDGFGAASVSTGYGITDSQADLFWSTTNGIGLSLLRVEIQSNGSYPELATMQKAKNRGVKIWGAPWSPPGAMKTNGSTSNGGNLKTTEYQAYADYLAGYVSGLKNSYGIDLYALSIQNEPNWTASYSSCIWSGQQFHDFLGGHLHSALAAKGLTTKVILPESAQWSFDLSTATLTDPVTAAEAAIVAAHNYDGGGAVAYPLGQNLGKHLWETEVSSFESFDPSISNGLKWAQKISDWMTVANANAWHYWWLVSGNSDNEALLGPGGATTKRLYAMGNFSKFVRPGYYRIGTTASPVSGVSVSAYKDPSTGKFAIVAINHNSSAVKLDFSLTGVTAPSVEPWVTSATLNLVAQPSIPVSGNVFAATLAAQSVTTFAGQ